jgi:hypothetical protein
MKVKSHKDFWSGLMFLGIGVAFAWGSTRYAIGEGARMGPGYFPLMLGVLLGLLGLFITFQALVIETEDGNPIGAWAWRPLAFVLASNFAFGVLLGGLPSLHVPAMGMVVAIVVLTFIAAFAGDQFNIKEIAILSVVLAVGSYLAFVLLLKLQFQVWPTFVSA